MNKNKGKAQQLRGHKRHAKVLLRQKHKDENKMFIVSLLYKYGKDLKLKSRPNVDDVIFTFHMSMLELLKQLPML